MNFSAARIAGAVLLLAAATTAWADDGFACAHDPELLPPRFRAMLEEKADARSAPALQQSFTPIERDIDPLGAEGQVPWTCHLDSLNARSGPDTSFPPVTQLTLGQEVFADFFTVEETDEDWLRFDLGGQPAWSHIVGLYRPHPLNVQNIARFGNMPYGTERVNRWWASPSTYEPSDLAAIPPSWTTSASSSFLLREEARDQVVALLEAARTEGVELRILSPYRSWSRQQSIYLGNTLPSQGGNLAQRFSAPPGHSEHQLGTTVDFAYQFGGFIDSNTAEHDWLAANGRSFGFRQTYLPGTTEITGYVEEPWHWRYFGVEPEAWMLH